MSIKNYSAVLTLSFALLAGYARAGEAPGADLTEDKIQALVKQLGDEDFAKRQAAEKALSAAGAKAAGALTAASASKDPQVRETASRLLGKIKLASLPAVDYLEVLPAKLIAGIQLKNIKLSVENAKKTAFGQLLASPGLEAFRAKFNEDLNSKPNEKKMAEQWLARFNGQIAGGVWEINFLQPDKIRAAAIGEITDPNPDQVFSDFLKVTNFAEATGKTELYKDVQITVDTMSGVALALVGKNMVFAANVDSLKEIVDGIMAPSGFGKSAEFAKLKPSLGAKPEMLVLIDFKSYINIIQQMAPMPGSFQDLIKATGMNMKWLVMTSAATGDTYEDRWVMSTEGPVGGLAAMNLPPENGPAPLNDMALIPANAVLATVNYTDGSNSPKAIGDYLDAMKKFTAQAPPGTPDISQLMKDFEAKAGISISKMMSGVKGTNGLYIVLAPTPTLAAPDIGMFYTFVDADKAKDFSTSLTKAINAYIPGAVREVAAGTRAIQQLDLAAAGLPVPPSFPYAPCWAADGNRVLVASSVIALKKQLNNIDSKAPGLLTSPDFVKAVGALTPEERKGQVFYMKASELLTVGGDLALPAAQLNAKDAELKKLLASLPASKQLFKDLPPVLMTSIAKQDQMLSVIRGPLPTLPTVFFGAMLAGFVRSAAPVANPPVNGGF